MVVVEGVDGVSVCAQLPLLSGNEPSGHCCGCDFSIDVPPPVDPDPDGPAVTPGSFVLGLVPGGVEGVVDGV